MNRFHALPLALAALLAACDDSTGPQAGTNDETHTTITARILLPDGATPAVGATVRLVRRDEVRAAATGLVEADGRPKVPRVSDGIYAMSASSGPLASWTDSVEVLGGRLLLASDDTLQKAGSISGMVLLQPQHDPRTITVNVLGTDIWANVGLDGRFTLPELGAGLLRLRFQTPVAEYTPLYRTVRLNVSQDTLLPDTLRMPFTGIPVILGLKAANDTATGDILVTWRSADHPRLVDYVVYRDSATAIAYSTTPYAATGDTLFRDTAAKSSSRPMSWKYRVAARVSGDSLPGKWHLVATATSIPPSLSKLREISWTYLGAPGGDLQGFLASGLATAALEMGTDSVRIPTWTSVDGSSWESRVKAFPARRMGQAVVRVAGFAAGRLWTFARSEIGDGIEVSSTSDGRDWTTAALPDSLWPGSSGLAVVGSGNGVGLVAQGTRGEVLLGDSTGSWRRTSVAGRVLGLDDSGLWSDAGTGRIVRFDLVSGRTVRTDLGTWVEPDAVRTLVPWRGSVLVLAGTRLWAREGSSWTLREAKPLNALAAKSDQLLGREASGTIWVGRP